MAYARAQEGRTLDSVYTYRGTSIGDGAPGVGSEWDSMGGVWSQFRERVFYGVDLA